MIEVDTEPGEYTEMVIELPLTVAGASDALRDGNRDGAGAGGDGDDDFGEDD